MVLGASLIGLALPASAMGAVTQHVVTNKVNGPSGFKVSFTVQQGQPTGYGGRYPPVVIVNVNQTSGSATQANQYTFSKGIHFTGSTSFKGGHFQGTFAKGRGSLNMTFHPKGSTFTAKVPSGCRGKGGKARRGTLSGSFTLKADKLGTIKIKNVAATLSNASYTCNPPTKGVNIFAPPTAKVGVNAYQGGGKDRIQIFSLTRGSGYNFLHSYTINVASSTNDYTFAPDLSSATLTGSNGIQGSATFTGTHKVSSKKYTGTMSGPSFSATMKAIGTVTPFAKPAKGYTQQKL